VDLAGQKMGGSPSGRRGVAFFSAVVERHVSRKADHERGGAPLELSEDFQE